MILVVADTSPIHYLVLIEAIGFLPQLYDRVVLPSAVVAELTHSKRSGSSEKLGQCFAAMGGSEDRFPR